MKYKNKNRKLKLRIRKKRRQDKHIEHIKRKKKQAAFRAASAASRVLT